MTDKPAQNSQKAKEARADEVYELTKDLATTGMWAEGLSGVVGFGVPLLVDAGMIAAYGDLWNDVRQVYGKGKITAHAAQAYLKPNLRFIMEDFVWDTVIGQIPIIGIPFNVVFAKATTWRLGIWFGALAALGDGDEQALDSEVSKATARMIKEVFPAMGSPFDMKAPERSTFVSFLASLDGVTSKTAQERLNKAIDVLSGKS